MRQRTDGVWYYEVNNLADIERHVIPFFRRFGFLAPTKQRDFAKFCELTALILQRRHLTPEGVREILEIRRDMNDGGKRRYTEEEILARCKTGESSETARQTPAQAPASERSDERIVCAARKSEQREVPTRTKGVTTWPLSLGGTRRN